MSVGTWEPPEKKKRTHIKLNLIRRFVNFATEVDLERKIALADVQTAGLENESWVMSKEKEYWRWRQLPSPFSKSTSRNRQPRTW